MSQFLLIRETLFNSLTPDEQDMLTLGTSEELMLAASTPLVSLNSVLYRIYGDPRFTTEHLAWVGATLKDMAIETFVAAPGTRAQMKADLMAAHPRNPFDVSGTPKAAWDAQLVTEDVALFLEDRQAVQAAGFQEVASGFTYELQATWAEANDQTYVDGELLNTPAKGVEVGGLLVKKLDGDVSVENNKLKFTAQATPAWDAQGARAEDSIARVLGKALFFIINMADLGANGFIIGWSSADNLNWPGFKRISWWANGLTGRLMLQITGSGSNPGVVDPMLTGTDYELAILLGGFNDNGEPFYSGQDPLLYLLGAQFFRRVGGKYILDWVDHKGSDPILYPALTNHSAAGTVKPFNVPDRDYRTVMIPSHFSSFNAAIGTSVDVIRPEVGAPLVLNGLWDVQAGGATTKGTVPADPRWTAISEMNVSDVFLHVPITPMVGEVGGIIIRHTDDNFIGIFVAEAANIFVIYEIQNGVWTLKDSKSITINAGVERILKVRAEGDRIIAMLDDTTATIDVTSALNVNSTKHGLRANVAGTTFGRLLEYRLSSWAYDELDANNEEVGFAGGGALLVDLISFWELEEASGTRFDAHGSNDLIDVNTVGQAIGKVGNAANFVRANGEKLTHVTNASLETGNIDFSFALWVRHTLETVALNIVYKGIDNPAKEYGLRYENTIDRFRWVISNGTGNFIVDANTFGAPTQGDWHFIVVFHDEANDEIGIGINNGAFDTFDMGGFTPVVQAKNFVIGEAASASAAFDGDIDQVGFWKRILTSAEITYLYNNGNGRSYAEISAF